MTIDKKQKPKILTESDHILNDLKEELADLKSRMTVIEEEQVQNRHLLDQLGFHEELANELISSQQIDHQINRENYEIIANALHNLKSPVTSVVDSLAGILSSVDDNETQSTLKKCMDTASNVLSSFSEVEEFCEDAGSVPAVFQTIVNIREYIAETVSAIQNQNPSCSQKSFRLQFNETIPDTCPVFTDTLKFCLESLLNELTNASPDGEITINITTENNEIKYGIEISDMAIHVELDKTVDYQWGESWVQSIQANQEKLLNFGFNLLKTRDFLHKTGGQLEVTREGNQVKGFRFFLPLTY